MRRWGTRGVHPVAWWIHRPPWQPALQAGCRYFRATARCCTTPELSGQGGYDSLHRLISHARRPSIFDRIPTPERTSAAWTALLDGALPPHLRNPDVTPPALTLDAFEVAEILQAAQYPKDDNEEAFDLLYDLGFNQDRWSAVVWLIKKLVDKFPARHGRSTKYAKVHSLWAVKCSLSDITSDMADLPEQSPFLLEMPPASGVSERIEDRTLADLTEVKENVFHTDTLAHDALGQVWRTLGAMTQACAGSEIRPEVLEVIAYLHHQEVMPTSIYQANPNPDRSAIQQPPLLPLLSSRILTSLSDAAWRAHQKLVIEEAKANGSEFSSLRPELLGSSYRVHVAGLRPEVWLELILWSCLHGGWIRPGIEILRSLVRSGQWIPLSWIQCEKELPPESATTSQGWSAWEYLFKTQPASSMDEASGPKRSVKQTISGELVNAYIDAMITSADVGVGTRGMPIDGVVTVLAELRSFLQRSRQSLSFGTWESLISRLLEMHCIDPEKDSGLLQTAVRSSGGGGFGQNLYAKNTQDLPSYVLDGSAAMLGALHRTLRGQIAAGSFESALEVFHTIQMLTDSDKRRSMVTFFGDKRLQGWHRNNLRPPRPGASLFNSLQEQTIFTSNLGSIDYPSFNVQIPTTTLGSFLQLVCDEKAFDFGRWLLYSDDIDGQVIPQSLYNDPFIQPGVVRFAVETNDTSLMKKLMQTSLSRQSMRSILTSQIRSLRWDGAVQVLEHLSRGKGHNWDMTNLAHLIKASLILSKDVESGIRERQQDFDDARRLLTDMVTLRYGRPLARAGGPLAGMHSELLVLAAINRSWADFCNDLRLFDGHHDLAIETSCFNLILDGAVHAYGSRAGRHLLGIFWPHAARRAFDTGHVFARDKRLRKRIRRQRPEALDSLKRVRILVKANKSESRDMVAYGAVVPNASTILIILRKALEELEDVGVKQTYDPRPVNEVKSLRNVDRDPDLTPIGIVTWAVRRLAELPYVSSHVVDSLDELLVKHGLEDIRDQLPEVYRMVEEEIILDNDDPAYEHGGDLDDGVASTTKERAAITG